MRAIMGASIDVILTKLFDGSWEAVTIFVSNVFCNLLCFGIVIVIISTRNWKALHSELMKMHKPKVWRKYLL